MTFQRWMAILHLSLNRNSLQLRLEPSVERLLRQACSDGIRPYLEAVREWLREDDALWLAGAALEAEEHIQKLKRGRGRFEFQNRLAA